MPPISERARSLGTENAFIVLNEVQARVARGADVTNFCIGQPDFVTPDAIRLAAIRALIEGKTGYTPSAGIAPLRVAIAETMRRTRGLDVAPDDVVVACGAKPFIGYVIQSVTDPGAGHEVVFPVPGFPIYESQARAQGAVPVPLPLRERNGFGLDVAELSRLLGPRTRLLILNSPHNPTGAVMTREDLEALADLLRAHPDVWVLSDEPYSALVYDQPFASLASVPGMAERTIVVDGASKTYAMPGWRIGYGVNRALAPLMARWVTNTESCAPQLGQWATVAALTGSQDATARMREAYRDRRARVVAGLQRIPGVTCAMPAGAFYAWPNVTGLCRRVGAKDSEALRRRLLEEAGVALLSDVHFGPRIAGEGEHLRLSFASSGDELEEGLTRIATFAREAGRSAEPAHQTA
jgi:aspartate/methionine/tyrosine aminotransferase